MIYLRTGWPDLVKLYKLSRLMAVKLSMTIPSQYRQYTVYFEVNKAHEA